MSENAIARAPWYRDPLWWRDQWPEVLFGLISAGAGGYALVLFGQIGEMAAAYPKALAAFGLVSFSVGALLGSSRRRHEREMERLRREEDRKDKQEELERQSEEEKLRREDQARRWVMGLTPDKKLLLLGLSREGSQVTGLMDSQWFNDFIFPVRHGVDSTMVDTDWKGNCAYRLSLNDFGETAVRVSMDLLEDVERIRAEREGNVAK